MEVEMKVFVATAILVGGLLLLAGEMQSLAVDYNGVRALLAQFLTTLRS
jgi:hypothetical protein